MNTYPLRPQKYSRGFTFVEAIVTIAIIGIMASMMIAAFANATRDTSRTVARQQQAALQGALNAWIGGDSNRVTTVGTVTKTRSVEEMRTAYNAMNTTQRLAAIEVYLAELQSVSSTEKTFWVTDTTRIKSRALDSIGSYLTLPTWAASVQPTVTMQ